MKNRKTDQKNKTGYPRTSATKDTGVRESDSPAAPAGVFADSNDASRYALLIKKYPLLPIKSEDSYDCALQILEALGDKINSSNATPSELGYFEVLSSLIENFEEKHYPSARSMQPNEFLRYLMNMNNLKQEDLIEEFGSQSRVSEFLNNKRDLTLKQIKKSVRAVPGDAFGFHALDAGDWRDYSGKDKILREMKRVALFCILALTLLGSAFHYFKSNYGTVVYALKDMPSRQVVKTGDIEERLIELKKIPGAAIVKSEEAMGNTLRYGVSRGQILSEYDFACKPYRCVFSARSIPKGKEIELADLKETTDDTKLAFVEQQLIVSAASKIVGKRAKDDIAMGEMLFEDNFQ